MRQQRAGGQGSSGTDEVLVVAGGASLPLEQIKLIDLFHLRFCLYN